MKHALKGSVILHLSTTIVFQPHVALLSMK
nr:unnamed protein product [Callosobruchus chinensis]